MTILPLELTNECKTSPFQAIFKPKHTYSISKLSNLWIRILPWLNDVFNNVFKLIISLIPVGLGSGCYRMVSELTGLEYLGALGFIWVHLASLTLSKLWTCIVESIYFHISYWGLHLNMYRRINSFLHQLLRWWREHVYLFILHT